MTGLTLKILRLSLAFGSTCSRGYERSPGAAPRELESLRTVGRRAQESTVAYQSIIALRFLSCSSTTCGSAHTYASIPGTW